jgi:hypothetical protein
MREVLLCALKVFTVVLPTSVPPRAQSVSMGAMKLKWRGREIEVTIVSNEVAEEIRELAENDQHEEPDAFYRKVGVPKFDGRKAGKRVQD